VKQDWFNSLAGTLAILVSLCMPLILWAQNAPPEEVRKRKRTDLVCIWTAI